MRNIFIGLVFALLVGCFHGVQIRPEAVAHKTGPVAYEDAMGVIVRNDDGTHSVVVFAKAGMPLPSSEETQRYYQSIMRDHVIDEREARALNLLYRGAVGDLATSQLGFNMGCVEKNPLFKSQNMGLMIVAKAWPLIITTYGAKQSTIYESMVNHDNRYINVLAASQWYLTGKNLYTISKGC